MKMARVEWIGDIKKPVKKYFLDWSRSYGFNQLNADVFLKRNETV